MTTKISGNLTEDARLIVFDEVTGSIEHNELEIWRYYSSFNYGQF